MALGKNIGPNQGIVYYLKDDFFLEKEGGYKYRLEWAGKLTKMLGLSGKVNARVWEAALSGYFPMGVRINGGSFFDNKGNRVRRAGTDFEFGAPKSVSILALVFGDERLIVAHRKAVIVAMRVLEEHIGCRRRHGGKEWENTGWGLVSIVTHFVSREGDPHLHDHVIYLNITLNSDEKFQAMTNDKMMHYQRLAQEVYFVELSKRLAQLGFEIERGEHGEPQIVGYTLEHIKEFSGRGNKILLYIKRKWGIDWEKLSHDEGNQKRWMHDEAWERTRKPKRLREIHALLTNWKERAKEIGAEKVLSGQGKTATFQERLAVAREVLLFSLDHHTEQNIWVSEGELLRTALQGGRGKISYSDLKKIYLQELKKDDIIIRSGDGPSPNLLTSQKAKEREKRILELEREGRGSVLPILDPLPKSLSLVRQKEQTSCLQLSDGLKILEKKHIEIEDQDLRYESIVERFIEERGKKETLVLAGSPETGEVLTRDIREAMNILGKGLEYPIFSVADWSVENLKWIGIYSVGQEIRFLRNDLHLGIEGGAIAKITQVNRENGKIQVETGRKTFELEPHLLSGDWEIGKSEMLKLSVGDRIRVTGNFLEESGIERGRGGRLMETTKEYLRILFDNERRAITIPVDEKALELDHGYVLSSYSRDIISKAKCLILDLSFSDPILNEKEFFRDLIRRNATIITFTDDWERLAQAVARKIEKSLSQDLEHLQEKKRENNSLGLDDDLQKDLFE